MMASETATSSSLETGVDPMPIDPRKFIGAVEDEWQLYSDRASDYEIGSPIGFGASSIVYGATYHPSSDPSQAIPCALKVLDLDSLPPRSLQLLQRETRLMSLSKHPNVLRVRGSWMNGHKLYIALRLMNKGSAADVMRYGWSGGMEEDVCRCILRQALLGLNYLHVNGFIHRDVKAANLLIDDDGTVLLGDLGVAADLSEDNSHMSSKSRISATAALANPISIASRKNGATEVVAAPTRPKVGKRKSFVGTPCWMAPELIQGKQYDASADIWSFAITALELTQGRPPRARESPQKVLLKTIQEDPPTLDREGGVFKYSRAFKEIIDSCLVKDPTKRPTAAELLQTSFFKGAKPKSYLINTILKDLPPLTRRQERRVVSNVASPNSMDSWDFSTSVHSPTTSIYRRSVLTRMVSEEEEKELRASGIFPVDEDDDDDERAPIHLQTDPELCVPSISPATSESSVFTRASSTPTTAPSSYVETPDSGWQLPQAADVLKSIPEVVRSPDRTVQDDEKEELLTPKTIRGFRERLPSSSSANSVSGSSPSLWKKLKGIKRPGSRGSVDSDITPTKDKTKGLFESTSRGLLSKTSSIAKLKAAPSTKLST